MSKQTSTQQAPDQGKRTAREYLRVSRDRSGQARSIDQQEADNRYQWPALAFNGESYSDKSIGASRYSTKVRGDYKRLINDIKNDRFDADVLVLWEASRGSRKVSEWVELIELCESKGIEIAVTTEERIYDPCNARDRKSLIDNASTSEYETSLMSQRVKRASQASADKGRPWGVCPIGYRRIYNKTTRQLEAQEPDPSTAPMISELFDHVATGGSLTAKVKEWEAAGIRNKKGNAYTIQHLRYLLTNRAYVGERVHHGESVPATWDPIVAPATFAKVQRILSDPSRKTRRPGSGKHLVSMIGQCGVCSGVLVAKYRRGRRIYQCNDRGCTVITADDVDDLAAEVTIGFLSSPSTYDRLMAQADDTAAAERLQADLEGIRAELDDLADQVGRGELSASLAARAEPAILQRLADAEAALNEALVPPVLDGIVGPEDDVRHMWSEASMAKRREVLRIVSGAIGTLTVHPSGVAGPNQPPAHERITFEK